MFGIKLVVFFKLPSSPYPPPTLSCNQGPWFTALSTRPAPVGTPPPHRASFKKHHFSFFAHVRNGARAPTTYTPRNHSPWTPLPSPCTHPHPAGYPSKKIIFLLFYALQTSKIRRKLRNLLRPWGPCPYHLPPRHRSPWTPPEPPLSAPTPLVYRPLVQSTGHPSKNIIFFFFVLGAPKIRRKLRNLLRPWVFSQGILQKKSFSFFPTT